MIKNQMNKFGLNDWARVLRTPQKIDGISKKEMRPYLLAYERNDEVMTKFVEYGMRDVDVLLCIINKERTITDVVEYARFNKSSIRAMFTKSRASELTEYICI